jgi:hypothetical protein
MNLHDEVLRLINQVGTDKLVAIQIIAFGGKTRYSDEKTEYCLSSGYNEDQLKEYLREIDFEYSSHENIYGCIWYTDGLWAEKNAGPNIDGFWYFHRYPELSELLAKNNGVTIIES